MSGLVDLLEHNGYDKRWNWRGIPVGILLAIGLTLIGSRAFAEKGWVIAQEDRLGGPRTIYLSQKGVRIESKNDGTVIVSSTPEWKVVTYSDQKKVFYECASSKFVNMLSKPIAVIYGVNLAPLPMKEIGNGTKYGVPVVLHEQKFFYDAKYWDRNVNAADARRLPLTARAETAKNIDVPVPVISTIERLYNIPLFTGIPLSFDYRDQDKTFHWYLRTNTVKSIDIAKVNFKAPTGYKRVQTLPEVLSKGENDDVLKNLF